MEYITCSAHSTYAYGTSRYKVNDERVYEQSWTNEWPIAFDCFLLTNCIRPFITAGTNDMQEVDIFARF